MEIATYSLFGCDAAASGTHHWRLKLAKRRITPELTGAGQPAAQLAPHSHRMNFQRYPT